MKCSIKSLVEYNGVVEDALSILYGHQLKSAELIKVNNQDGILLKTEVESLTIVLKHEQDCCERINFIDQEPILVDNLYKETNLITNIKFDIHDIRENFCTTLTTLLIHTGTDYETTKLLRFSWIGESNGYYNTTVDAYLLTPPIEDEPWNITNIEIVKELWKSLE
jgi:hypothetical protein